jgi:hypothetical protein
MPIATTTPYCFMTNDLHFLLLLIALDFAFAKRFLNRGTALAVESGQVTLRALCGEVSEESVEKQQLLEVRDFSTTA